ncbi:MAG: HisA/HisF-related TIM barrel protein, partial [Firmicutes bacterium]|nr:HisA/HisF-related TIM barrel protein [Bacillota bacterium]
MEIFPAIDLSGGKVVRLTQGDYQQMEVYGDDPVAAAQEFARQGANYLHVVDLDGAKDGTLANFTAIAEIVRNCDLRVEVGGGIRTEER